VKLPKNTPESTDEVRRATQTEAIETLYIYGRAARLRPQMRSANSLFFDQRMNGAIVDWTA
jgi:hypothetical protein